MIIKEGIVLDRLADDQVRIGLHDTGIPVTAAIAELCKESQFKILQNQQSNYFNWYLYANFNSEDFHNKLVLVRVPKNTHIWPVEIDKNLFHYCDIYLAPSRNYLDLSKEHDFFRHSRIGKYRPEVQKVVWYIEKYLGFQFNYFSKIVAYNPYGNGGPHFFEMNLEQKITRRNLSNPIQKKIFNYLRGDQIHEEFRQYLKNCVL